MNKGTAGVEHVRHIAFAFIAVWREQWFFQPPYFNSGVIKL